ncbi:hypothetical protein [Haloarchaeobius sp. FL176]|uniref:hypothetical protein n=1 Tax=Haloarchaeobius sp. FL176 TaxID=2967129 RepID=UPI002148BFF2|nr:hypothetical protein [Haloarchaeobius sp. FL176]
MAAAPNRDRGHDAAGVDAVDFDPYVAIDVGDGEILLFDEGRSTAWIQSSVAVSVEEAV